MSNLFRSAHRFSIAFAVGAILVSQTGAMAQTASLAYWSFNDVPTTTTDVDQSVRDALASPDGGLNVSSASMSFSDLSFTDGPTSGAGVTTFAGTLVNNTLPNGSTLTAGNALAIQGFTNTANNGHYLQFGVSTVGYDTVSVSYATRGTGTGFNSVQFQYSTNGVNFTNFGDVYNGTPTTFSARNYDLSAITDVSNNSLTTFRILFNGATSAAGNNRIDNLQINGSPLAAVVPEPGTVILMTIPAILGMIVYRRNRRQA